MRDGGPGSHSIPEDKRCVDLVRKSLAEWCYRALGGELPPRVARLCDCSKRAPPETSPFRVRVLLSRGSHASWARPRYATHGRVLSYDRLGELPSPRVFRPSLYMRAPCRGKVHRR